MPGQAEFLQAYVLQEPLTQKAIFGAINLMSEFKNQQAPAAGVSTPRAILFPLLSDMFPAGAGRDLKR
jgi:hypothetical protein